jgi:hypothetical protein
MPVLEVPFFCIDLFGEFKMLMLPLDAARKKTDKTLYH